MLPHLTAGDRPGKGPKEGLQAAEELCGWADRHEERRSRVWSEGLPVPLRGWWEVRLQGG